jgi:hypothetical protein
VVDKNSAIAAAVALGSLSGVSLENLKIQNTNSAGIGISSSGASACVLRRVWVDGPFYGAQLSAFNSGLVDQCQATSNSYAWQINGRAVTVQNTIGICNATSDPGAGNSLS